VTVHESLALLDPIALALLDSEYDHTFIGRKLLSAANYCRHAGIGEDAAEDLIRSSHLSITYQASTSSNERKQDKAMSSAIRKAYRGSDFELSDSLSALWERVSSAAWTGRNGSRDRAVLLAFIWFCWEHNCFTRTLSTYELAAHTDGLSPGTVSRALASLVTNHGRPLTVVPRKDRRPSRRSAQQYRLRLDWHPSGGAQGISGTGRAISSRQNLLPHDDGYSDLWSPAGLGETARRLWDVVDHHGPEGPWLSLAELAKVSGMTGDMARRAMDKLFEYGLVARRPRGKYDDRPSGRCKPAAEYRRGWDVDYEILAYVLGVQGAVQQRTDAIRYRQEANRASLPLQREYKLAKERADEVIRQLAEKRKRDGTHDNAAMMAA
jgi:DNA-binding transcriptional ArsR family regulator